MKPINKALVGFALGLFLFSLLNSVSVFAEDLPPPDSYSTDPAANSIPPDTVPDPTPAPTPLATPTPAPVQELPPKRDSRVPLFYDVKPQWGFQFNFSPNALGGVALTTEQANLPAYAFTLTVEFQPRFLQTYGVLGLGLSTSIFPIFGGNNLNPSLTSLWSAGGQIRYQAKYFRQQILVPNIAYNYDYFTYAYSAGKNGALKVQGLTYGLWLLLNPLDSSAASNFYIDAGVARTYLTFEATNLSGNDGTVNVGGFSYYVGLRMEL